jgi:hypothetical protein
MAATARATVFGRRSRISVATGRFVFPEEVAVLHVERPVETHQVPGLGEPFRGRLVLTEVDRRRIAGNQVEH